MLPSPHILIIPSWYPSNAKGFKGSFFREQAIALADNSFKVGVIAPIQTSLKDWKYIKFGITSEEDNNVQTLRSHTVRWFPSSGHANSYNWLKHGEKLYERYVEQYGKPDIIHAHSILYGGVLAAKILKKYDIPYVITEHSSLYSRNKIKNKQKYLAEGVVKNSSGLFAVSQSFCEFLQTFFSENLGYWHEIPNIVSPCFLNYPLINTDQDKKNKFTFLSISTLTPNKAVDNLIRAFSYSFRGDSSVSLRIGGSGSELSSLKNIARDEGVIDQVNFLGKLTRNNVLDEMSKTDVFVLSSHYETFGVVAIEALALGKPVVSTQCGGPNTIVNPSNGLLVPVNDINKLADALVLIRDNFKLYDAIRIRDSCMSMYSGGAIANKLINTYTNLLISRKGMENE